MIRSVSEAIPASEVSWQENPEEAASADKPQQVRPQDAHLFALLLVLLRAYNRRTGIQYPKEMVELAIPGVEAKLSAVPSRMKVELPHYHRKERRKRREGELGEVHWTSGLGAGRGGLEGLGVGVLPVDYLQPQIHLRWQEPDLPGLRHWQNEKAFEGGECHQTAALATTCLAKAGPCDRRPKDTQNLAGQSPGSETSRGPFQPK